MELLWGGEDVLRLLLPCVLALTTVLCPCGFTDPTLLPKVTLALCVPMAQPGPPVKVLAKHVPRRL